MSRSEARAQRLHDLRGTLTGFKSVLRLIRSGYRFDDEDGPGALAQLEKAVDVLEREIASLSMEWNGEAKSES